MKKRIYLFTLLVAAALCIGCGEEKTESSDSFDFTYDYSEQIKADVDYMVSTSSSLQEELENIDKIIEKYNPLAEAAQTQGEMNVASGWFYTIWDTELNSLWSRFTNIADEQTKDTEAAEGSPFTTGEEFLFPIAF